MLAPLGDEADLTLRCQIQAGHVMGRE